MTSLRTNPREIWRIVRLVARYYDRTWPSWWNDPRAMEAIQRSGNETLIRCWRHAVRLRRGE